jgi:hypothetical protein
MLTERLQTQTHNSYRQYKPCDTSFVPAVHATFMLHCLRKNQRAVTEIVRLTTEAGTGVVQSV